MRVSSDICVCLATWSISNKQATDAILQTFGAEVLPAPQVTR